MWWVSEIYFLSFKNILKYFVLTIWLKFSFKIKTLFIKNYFFLFFFHFNFKLLKLTKISHATCFIDRWLKTLQSFASAFKETLKNWNRTCLKMKFFGFWYLSHYSHIFSVFSSLPHSATTIFSSNKRFSVLRRSIRAKFREFCDVFRWVWGSGWLRRFWMLHQWLKS